MPGEDGPNSDAVDGIAPGTVGAAYQWMRKTLRTAGLDSADLDARRLLSAATGIAIERMVAWPEAELDRAQRTQLAAFVQRRLVHEPVSRIVGERGFYGLTLRVTPATLDPRPETETIVDVALDMARARDRQNKARPGGYQRPLRVLDIGTGSGAIAIAILVAREADPATRGHTRVVATDIDPNALAVAALNARRCGVDHLISFRLVDRLAGLAGPFDLLVSNPPYIPQAAIADLEPDVRNFDPHRALDGGGDGLDFYRTLIGGAHHLVPTGAVVLEIGRGQNQAIAELVAQALPAARVSTLNFTADMAGVPRCAAFWTQN